MKCPVAATKKMIVCFYPFVMRECGSAASSTRAAAIVAKGKRVRTEGGLRRFSRTFALAPACRCEVRT